VPGQIATWGETADKSKKTIMIHASSMGEFEHIKPLIVRLNQQHELNVIVTFFSPSAFEVVKTFEGVDLFIYLPFDTHTNWRRIYALVEPVMVVISKHDVWPNQVWIARDKKIPVFLINASLSESSGRTAFPARILLGQVYRSLTGIYTIGQEDCIRFERNFHGLKLKVLGDTKFDQVMLRREAALKKQTVNEEWIKESTVIVLGSIWPEDAEHTLGVVNQLLAESAQFKVIIVPHQPHERFLEQVAQAFPDYPAVLYTRRETMEGERIMLVDIVGVLADLYCYADIAYVGGSFRQGIHNVMEPAIYHIPVIYGPFYKNSFEAIRLNEAGGSAVIRNAEEFGSVLRRLLTNEGARRRMGDKAWEYAIKNTGATDRIIKEWKPLITSD
jgi:3-deoxy-D-manno-octulosonic-acid transferase